MQHVKKKWKQIVATKIEVQVGPMKSTLPKTAYCTYVSAQFSARLVGR